MSAIHPASRKIRYIRPRTVGHPPSEPRGLYGCFLNPYVTAEVVRCCVERRTAVPIYSLCQCGTARSGRGQPSVARDRRQTVPAIPTGYCNAAYSGPVIVLALRCELRPMIWKNGESQIVFGNSGWLPDIACSFCFCAEIIICYFCSQTSLLCEKKLLLVFCALLML